jgi:hypothetical protein
MRASWTKRENPIRRFVFTNFNFLTVIESKFLAILVDIQRYKMVNALEAKKKWRNNIISIVNQWNEVIITVLNHLILLS